MKKLQEMLLTEVRSTETFPEMLSRLKSLKLLFYLFTLSEVSPFLLYYFLCIVNNYQSRQQHHAIIGTLRRGVLFSNAIVGCVVISTVAVRTYPRL